MEERYAEESDSDWDLDLTSAPKQNDRLLGPDSEILAPARGEARGQESPVHGEAPCREKSRAQGPRRLGRAADDTSQCVGVWAGMYEAGRDCTIRSYWAQGRGRGCARGDIHMALAFDTACTRQTPWVLWLRGATTRYGVHTRVRTLFHFQISPWRTQ